MMATCLPKDSTRVAKNTIGCEIRKFSAKRRPFERPIDACIVRMPRVRKAAALT